MSENLKEYLQSILDNENYQKLRKYEDLTQFYQDKYKNALDAVIRLIKKKLNDKKMNIKKYFYIFIF